MNSGKTIWLLFLLLLLALPLTLIAENVPLGSATYPLEFLLVGTDGNYITGATPSVFLSKNGAAFAEANGTVAEVGYGMYKVSGSAVDTNTQGPLWLHVHGTTVYQPTDFKFKVEANTANIQAYVFQGLPAYQAGGAGGLVCIGTGNNNFSSILGVTGTYLVSIGGSTDAPGNLRDLVDTGYSATRHCLVGFDSNYATWNSYLAGIAAKQTAAEANNATTNGLLARFGWTGTGPYYAKVDVVDWGGATAPGMSGDAYAHLLADSNQTDIQGLIGSLLTRQTSTDANWSEVTKRLIAFGTPAQVGERDANTQYIQGKVAGLAVSGERDANLADIYAKMAKTGERDPNIQYIQGRVAAIATAGDRDANWNWLQATFKISGIGDANDTRHAANAAATASSLDPNTGKLWAYFAPGGVADANREWLTIAGIAIAAPHGTKTLDGNVALADGTPLANAKVEVYTTAAKTGLVTVIYTDTFGYYTTPADSGTYYLWVTKPGYAITNPIVKVVLP